jgi:hypothetical protein
MKTPKPPVWDWKFTDADGVYTISDVVYTASKAGTPSEATV